MYRSINLSPPMFTSLGFDNWNDSVFWIQRGLTLVQFRLIHRDGYVALAEREGSNEMGVLVGLDVLYNRLDRQEMDVSKAQQLEMQLQFRLDRETSAVSVK